MTNKKTQLLLKALLDVSEAHSARVVRGNTKRANIRHMASCGALATRRTSLPLSPVTPTITSSRSLINLVVPISTRRMEYTEHRTLGFTPEQMYNIVADVDQYQQFVPWCKKSRILKGPNGTVKGELVIGFPPVSERYISDVTCIPNHQIRLIIQEEFVLKQAVCTDGSLFSHLETIWRFSPGSKDLPDSCKVDFYVCFEFRSLLHTQLAGVFFDEVVKQMVSAFEFRAETLYRSQQEASLRRRST